LFAVNSNNAFVAVAVSAAWRIKLKTMFAKYFEKGKMIIFSIGNIRNAVVLTNLNNGH